MKNNTVFVFGRMEVKKSREEINRKATFEEGSSPSPTLLSKKQKGGGEDRISELPDDVLCHILSFLPSNEAIATCLLSSRWRFLWTMVPALDFDYTKPTTYDKVNKFLSLSKTRKITRFRLYFDNYGYEHHWVSAAIDAKVEQLDISLYRFSNVIRLFSSVNWCTTVVSLKLTGSLFVPCFMSINLPSLKTLHLDVEECAPAALKKLLRGSPALELCHLKQHWNVSLRLKELKIVSNSQGITLIERNDKFELVIQSNRDYNFVPDYLEGHLENVVKAKVYVTVFETNYSLIGSHVYLVLQALHNVEFMFLSNFRVEMNDYDRPFALDRFPQFRNLVQLRHSVKDRDSLLMELPGVQDAEFVILEDGCCNGINKRRRYHISGQLWENDRLFSERIEFLLILFLVVAVLFLFLEALCFY